MSRNSSKQIIPFSLLTILVLLLSLTLSLPAQAADATGRISGRLLDGTTNKAPLAGQQVTLQMAQGQNAQDLKTVTTDAQGNYVFDHLATDKTNSYAVYGVYQGAQYITDVITLDSKPEQQLDLVVYQATSSSAKVFVGSMTALVSEPNLEKGTITISEIFSISNLDNHTYVGSLESSKGKPNALLFSLPRGIRNLSADKGFNGYHVVQVDTGFASNAAVLPGDNEFSFSYEVPYTTSKLDLQYTTEYPTLAVSFMVPPDIELNSSQLSPAGTTNSGNDQRPYTLYKSSDQLTANQQLSIQLAGLTVPEARQAPFAVRSTTIWLMIAVVLMLAIVALTWFYRRNLIRERAARQAALRNGQKRSLRAQETSNEGTKTSGQKKKAISEEEQELLQELLELDQDYEAKKLTEAVYQERRKKIKARLRIVLREKETADR